MKKKSILGFMDGEAKIVRDIEASSVEQEREIKIEHRGAWEEHELDDLFVLADQLESVGRVREAFRLMKIGAEAGDCGMQHNLGYMYDTGRGVSRNRERAMHWYKRAYRQGSMIAANNIGTIYRDEENWRRALYWFRRAIQMGDIEANLEIAKILIKIGKPSAKVRHYLRKVILGKPPLNVGEDSQEEAAALLKTLAR